MTAIPLSARSDGFGRFYPRLVGAGPDRFRPRSGFRRSALAYARLRGTGRGVRPLRRNQAGLVECLASTPELLQTRVGGTFE